MSFSQTVFLETFDEADDATTGVDNSGGSVAWTATCPGSIAATDYLKVVSGKLEARDTNSPGASFTSGSIDVTSCVGLEISFDIEESGDLEDCADCGGTGIICVDWVKLEYNLDGAGWTEVAGSSCVATMTEAPGEMVQIGDIPGGGPITFTSPCIDFGTSLQIRISCMSWAGTEYWRFDNVTVSCNDCILPVEMVDFSIKETKNNERVLFWSTLTERENDRFEIERSLDGNNFEVIGAVKGAGNSVTKNDYHFEDETEEITGTVYYRLKQVDFNGKITYSKTISHFIQPKAKFYYNGQSLTYQINQQLQKELHLNIYDLSGTIVYQTIINDQGTLDWTKKGFFLIEIPELGHREKLIIQ